MTKKILVGLIAALMLFAFVACEQTPIEMPKAVVSASIRQTGTFLVGQPFDASKFVVDVTYSDGSVVPLTGTNVTSTTGEDGVTNGQIVYATAGTGLHGNSVTTQTSLVAYTIDSLSVAGTLPNIEWKGAVVNPTANLKEYASELTVTANYRDSSNTAQTLDLESSEWTITRDNLSSSPSAEEPTVTGTATITATLQGADVQIPVTFIFVEEEAVTYEWFDHQVVYGQVTPSAGSVAYVQRGVFNPETMIQLYKVYAPEDTTTLGDDYYLVPLAQTDSDDYVSLSMTLATPYTNADIEGLGTNRFADNSTTANVNFSMKYIGNEGTGAYATKTSVNGSVVIADLEAVTVADITDEATGFGEEETIYTGDITSSSAIQIVGIIADYPLTLSVSVNDEINTSTDTTVDVGDAYAELVGNDALRDVILATVATWKSGVGLEGVSAENYGTFTFDPVTAENATEAIAADSVSWTFAPNTEYSDSYDGMDAFESSTSLSIYVNPDTAN